MKPVRWVRTKIRAQTRNVGIVRRDLIQIRRATLIVLGVHPVNNVVVHGANMVLVEPLAKTVLWGILRPVA